MDTVTAAPLEADLLEQLPDPRLDLAAGLAHEPQGKRDIIRDVQKRMQVVALEYDADAPPPPARALRRGEPGQILPGHHHPARGGAHQGRADGEQRAPCASPPPPH